MSAENHPLSTNDIFALDTVGRHQTEIPSSDPAEDYHTASSWEPSFYASELPNAAAMMRDSRVAELAHSGSKEYGARPLVSLPPAVFGWRTLKVALRNRRSSRGRSGGVLSAGELATILASAYASTGTNGGVALRPTPSAGALYPIELYAAVVDCDELERGLYYFEGPEHRLRSLDALDLNRLKACFIDPAMETICAVVFFGAMFQRTRFKYGLRGYRFALIEAGHAAQNMLLTCAALAVPAVPTGGFFDRAVSELLGVDGVNEAPVYSVVIGGR